MRLRVHLLGGFSARFDDGAPCVLRTRKMQALLAYLALSAGQFHSRSKLATLLWGDVPEAQAQQSFRQALAGLRRALQPRPDALLQAGDAIALDRQAVVVDVLELEATLADGTLPALERVAALYRGDLLEGFAVHEPGFEEWCIVQRERLHEVALEGLAKLLRGQTEAGHLQPAIHTAMRVLALDPLQEAVHRTLMRLLVRQGRRAAALQQYQACVATLQRELSSEPEEETRQLYREILSSTRVASTRPVSTPLVAVGDATGTRAIETPMIGREDALEQLRAAVSRMLDEGGRVVLVTGEAGIGKSRLIQEFVASEAVRACWLSFGRCHQTEQTLPFRPWIEALRGDGDALDDSLRERLGAATCAPLATLFPELLASRDAAVTASASPALLFEPLLELIGGLAAHRPVVIVVEDLHWADTMSARLLAFLGRRIHRWPVLLVGSTRPEELVDAPALTQALEELRNDGRLDEVVLGPLSEDQGRRLAQALRPSRRVGPDWDRLEREIWTASEGNPFVIVESIRGLQSGPRGTWTLGPGMGRRVQDFVAVRLARLAELPRHCVAVAATIGRDFSFALLARAAHLSERETAEAVEQLVRRRILDAVGDGLDFCHDWIRRVAYEALLPVRRPLLHAAVGEALEDLYRERLDDVADQLGSHFSRAGDFRRAIPHLMRFGYLAGQRYALDDAYRALAQAMAGVEQLPAPERSRRRIEVALQQAFVLSILGRQQEILELLEADAAAVERLPDPVLAAEYWFRLGLTYFFLGRRAQAQRAAEQALARGERAGNPEAIGKALHVLSLQGYEMGRPDDGIAHAMRAIGLLDQPHTQAWLGLAYQDLALNHVVAGNLEAALESTERMEAIGRCARIPRLLAFAGYVGAWAHALRGAPERAIEIGQSALALSRDPAVMGLISGSLGQAYLELGDAGAAESILTEAVDRLADGPIRHARVRNLVLLGETHLLAGDRVRAREVAGHALDLARLDETPLNIGLAQRSLGRIAHAGGDLEAAGSCLCEALGTFVGCHAAFEAARTRLDLAAVDAARGKTDAAREHLAAALATFETANAPRLATAARALAASLGPALPVTPGSS
jgi:DNA-binding SARP family transcriptional activator